MPQLVPSLYRHVQTSAASTWVIEHNLHGGGSDGTPIVDVFVTEGGNTVKIMPTSITKTSQGTVTIAFSAPRSGEAIIIV